MVRMAAQPVAYAPACLTLLYKLRIGIAVVCQTPGENTGTGKKPHQLETPQTEE